MFRMRIQGALFVFVLFAAVAVFSNAGNNGSMARGKANMRSSSTGSTVVLTADGTDPVPKPTPYSMVELAA